MSDQPNEQTLVLKEILKWVKFTGLKEVKSILLKSIDDDPRKLLVYYLSDGDHGVRDIVSATGVSDKPIATLWSLWLKMGLGENVPVRGGLRFKRSFDPQELGIEIPEIKEKNKKETSLGDQPTITDGADS